MGHRVRKIVVDDIHGTEQEQFKRLRYYADAVLSCNPGSTVVIKANALDGEDVGVFESIFVAYGSIIQGTLRGCRKIIGLDGCHLKAAYGGVMLSAVSDSQETPTIRYIQ